ncbi:MAG: DUF4258 domain-containing protein [Candidatus Heimdallarchaeota archaeon]
MFHIELIINVAFSTQYWRKIIEKYENDRPFPSCVVFRKIADRRSFHIICAFTSHVCGQKEHYNN